MADPIVVPRRDQMPVGADGLLDMRFARFIEALGPVVNEEPVDDEDEIQALLGGAVAGQLGVLTAELARAGGDISDIQNLIAGLLSTISVQRATISALEGGDSDIHQHIASLVALHGVHEATIEKLEDDIQDLRNLILWQ